VREVQSDRPDLGLLVVTHYQRLLDEIHPSHVHLLLDGRIVESGGMEIVARLEADGYESWRTPVGA
jgi:Fe-S cluster assembly ATP-binding protein